MQKDRITAWLTWVLIVAQTSILVLGHGRVVVCHDEGGSSHIEIVNKNSCSTQADNACSQQINTQGDAQFSPLCSVSSCVDEPFGLIATLSRTRLASYGEQGVETNPSSAIASWLLAQDPLEGQVCCIEFDDQHAIYKFHRSNRSTVLVL